MSSQITIGRQTVISPVRIGLLVAFCGASEDGYMATHHHIVKFNIEQTSVKTRLPGIMKQISFKTKLSKYNSNIYLSNKNHHDRIAHLPSFLFDFLLIVFKALVPNSIFHFQPVSKNTSTHTGGVFF
jgi:hypothetical protein